MQSDFSCTPQEPQAVSRKGTRGGGRGWGSQCAASLIGAHYPQRQTTTATDDKAEKKQDTSEASIAHGVRRGGNSGSVFRRR